MTARRWTSEDLDEYADRHIGYEVQMLVACALELRRRWDRMPRRHEPTIDDALLEATLVHLRLLNEFLSSSDSRGVQADHWASGQHKGFLSELGERQQHHLSVAK